MLEVLWVFPAVCVVAIVIAKSGAIIEMLWPNFAHSLRYSDFIQERYAAGISMVDIHIELETRTEFARLRREASDAVGRDPANWLSILDKAKADTLIRLKAERRIDVAQGVAFMLQGLTYDHILYPAEAKMVDRLPVGPALGEPYPGHNDDMIAALRIVRPS